MPVPDCCLSSCLTELTSGGVQVRLTLTDRDPFLWFALVIYNNFYVSGEFAFVDSGDSLKKLSMRVCSVKQLVRTYSRKFPIIVKVTQGYYDNGGLELTTNEVSDNKDIGRQTTRHP